VNAPDSTYQYPRQSPYLVVNSAMSFIVNQHYTFSVNVNNVFDRGVPFPYSTILNSSNRYYDAIMGRYVRVSVKANSDRHVSMEQKYIFKNPAHIG
jgi:outer membrane receptor protein involved in Fe transport